MTMESERFDQIIEERCASIRKTLKAKAAEYARGDRLHNFKVAGRRLGCTPERALVGMKEKHCVSVMDIVSDLERGIIPSQAFLNEKLGDEINYLFLLEGLIQERIDDEARRMPCQARS